MKVIISAGAGNFHMNFAASEIAKYGALHRLYTGVVPTKGFGRLLTLNPLLSASKRTKLVLRGSSLDKCKITSFAYAEAVSAVGLALKARGSWISSIGRGIYAQAAARALSKEGQVDVYHFRAGFGGRSIAAAKAMGAITVCDHSIAHPLILEDIVENGGKLEYTRRKLDALQSDILRDIKAADYVLVNSEFVERTFEAVGDVSKLAIINQGLDDMFVDLLDNYEYNFDEACCNFLFAGRFGERKGAKAILSAIEKLPETGWSLKIAGTVEPEFVEPLAEACKRFPILTLGNLTRAELAREMKRSDYMVFPSLAEGSARVTIEALAAGCGLITTLNSGCPLRAGDNLTIVPVNDPLGLAHAMLSAMAKPRPLTLRGEQAASMREQFNQRRYGTELIKFYNSIALNN